MIRIAEKSDIEHIDSIYNEAVARGFCTADLAPIGMDKRLEWFEAHPADKFPVYVYVEDGKVVGWASLSPYRKRKALAEVAEISYYVASTHHRKGIATQLVDFALKDTERLNLRIIFAIIIEGNIPSIRLMEKFGFEQWGFMPDVNRFGEEKRAHVYMGKILRQ
jgi:phosphinothricin acetyltransferase